MENLDPHFTRAAPCCWVEIWTQTFMDLSGCNESGNLEIGSMEEINPSPIITEKLLHATTGLPLYLVILKPALRKHPAFTLCNKSYHHPVAMSLNQYFCKAEA